VSGMFATWQDFAALVIVVAACAYLLWRGWLVVKRRRAGCGACSTCPSSEANGKPLVKLELTSQAEHRAAQ
jgi:hypothetical protein